LQKPAKRLSRSVALFIVFQTCCERRRFLAEDLGHVGVHRRDWRLGHGAFLFEARIFNLKVK
jgi:hypothetical protein